MSIFGPLLCCTPDERSICCAQGGFLGEREGKGVGYCEGWHAVRAQTHSTGSPAIPLAYVPGIHHKYFSNIIAQPCPSHFAKRGGETFGLLSLSLMACKLFFAPQMSAYLFFHEPRR